jgi:hypothetical protein
MLLVAWLLLFVPVQRSLFAQQAQAPAEAPPGRMKIEVLTQLPLTEPAGALSANSLEVRITDEWGMPVRGATVSFRLPEAGPGGVFLNGLSSEIAITDERGEAAVKGFDWRPEAGVTFVHVIAAYGSVRAGGMAEVQLTRKAAASAPQVQPQPTPRATQPDAAAPPANAQGPLGRTEPGGQQATQQTVSRPPASVRDQTPTPPPAFQPPDITPRRDAYSRPDPEAEDPGQQSPAMARGTGANPYVRVKQGGANGGNKTLKMLLLVGAAAGGAIAVGLATRSSSSAAQPGGAAPPAPVRIGNPSISVTTTGGRR